MTVFGENGRIEQKGKGCDIGYVLTTGSCEKPIAWKHAPSQPLDAITAFAVPDPNYSSQSSRFFQVWLPNRSPCRAITQSTSDWLRFISANPFDRRRGAP